MILTHRDIIIIDGPRMLGLYEKGVIVSKMLKIMNSSWDQQTREIKQIKLSSLH